MPRASGKAGLNVFEGSSNQIGWVKSAEWADAVAPTVAARPFRRSNHSTAVKSSARVRQSAPAQNLGRKR